MAPLTFLGVVGIWILLIILLIRFFQFVKGSDRISSHLHQSITKRKAKTMDQGQTRICPFCGSDNIFLLRGQYGLLSRVCCGDCAAMGPARAMVTEAVTLWNNRHLGYPAMVKATVIGVKSWKSIEELQSKKDIPQFRNRTEPDEAMGAAQSGTPRGRYWPLEERGVNSAT
jgi:Lar family restriction alleviation protein